MGNSHSHHELGRRPSLVREEFLFPETDSAPEDEVEVYHVHIELKPLPAHARDSIHVCVDDYTQEILSWEEDCVCACAIPRGRDKWYSNTQKEGDSVCGSFESENGQDFCFQWDAHTDNPCDLEFGQTEINYPCNAHRQNVVDEDMGSLANFLEERYIPDCSNLENPCEEDVAETNIPNDERTEKSILRNNQTTPKEPTKPIDIPGSRHREHTLSSQTMEMTMSQNEQQRCSIPDCEAAASGIWMNGRVSTTKLRTRANTTTSKTSTDQEQAVRNNYATYPRRSSCSIPILPDKTTTMPFKPLHDSKKRKFSLKDEPGWIPNPLDSDSENGDFEDSGVFSDFTGSPATSTGSSEYVPPTSKATAKLRVLARERKRYNSEPMQRTVTPSPTSPPQQGTDNPPPVEVSRPCSGTKPGTRRGSYWRLLRLSRKVREPQKIEDPVPVEGSPQFENDLSEQLRWLAMSDSEISQDAESSPENDEESFSSPEKSQNADSSPDREQEGVNSSETSPNTHSSCMESMDTRHPPTSSGEEAASRRARSFDGELELDWLCEPEWNNLELELFWTVLRPHLEHLLQPEDSELLPDACRAVGRMDAADPKMLDRCLLHVQWHIWKGSYCQAVADFRAIRRHFLCCAQSQLIESGTRNDVENLRLIFQRKRPSRFRLWI